MFAQHAVERAARGVAVAARSERRARHGSVFFRVCVKVWRGVAALYRRWRVGAREQRAGGGGGRRKAEEGEERRGAMFQTTPTCPGSRPFSATPLGSSCFIVFTRYAIHASLRVTMHESQKVQRADRRLVFGVDPLSSHLCEQSGAITPPQVQVSRVRDMPAQAVCSSAGACANVMPVARAR